MSEKLQLAIALAKQLHCGQVDKQGEDYFLHPKTVASYVESEEAKIVAYLHDTLEDCSDQISKEDLEIMFGSEISNAVVLLTRPKDISYFDYVRRIKTNDLAKQVKLADLKHNTSPERGAIPDSLRERYEKAKIILLE